MITPAALALAAQGLPVFPCGLNKRPCLAKDEGGRGFHDATTDPDQVRRLFSRRAAVLVGTPSGERSGFDVLDLDYRNGAAAWEAANLHRIPETRVHQTKSGGRHLLFVHAPGVANLASKFAPGVDVRGTGGYVIYPPSPGYTVISDAPIAHWPDWLLTLVLPKPGLVPPVARAPREPISAKRVEAIIDATLNRVRAAGEGQKHFTLRNAALLLGGIQDGAGFRSDEAIRWLLDALPRSVSDWQNARRTAEWGLEQGRTRPLPLNEDTLRQQPDPHRREIARAAFKLLRAGVAGENILAVLDQQNAQRPDPFPRELIRSTVIWAAYQLQAAAHA